MPNHLKIVACVALLLLAVHCSEGKETQQIEKTPPQSGGKVYIETFDSGMGKDEQSSP